MKQNEKIKVAYQGGPGAFSEEAALNYFESYVVTPTPYQTFDDVAKAVKNNDVNYGLIPIRNTVFGEMNDHQSLINTYNLKVVDYYLSPIVMCLITAPRTKISDLKTVYSHPKALPQCSEYVLRNKLKPIEHVDTALAVKEVIDRGLWDSAAIASKRAAKIYGGTILARNIQNNKKNFTEFAICVSK